LSFISNDGSTLLFSEQQEGGGAKGSVYLRRTDGSPAFRLGDGQALGLSPDGKWALAAEPTPSRRYVLLPTGVGQVRPLDTGSLTLFGAGFLPDGRVAFGGSESGHGLRVHVLDLAGGKPHPFTEEGITDGAAASPDGRHLALCGRNEVVKIYPVDGGPPRPVAGAEPGEVPIQWSADGRALYLTRRGELPEHIERLDLATGKKEIWKELLPADRAGLIRISTGAVSLPSRTEDVVRRGALGAVFIVLALVAGRVAESVFAPRLDTVSRYNLRRILRLLVGLAIVLILVSAIFVNWYTAIVSFGVLSLILGFALQTPITSFIGWIYILVRKPYR